MTPPFYANDFWLPFQLQQGLLELRLIETLSHERGQTKRVVNFMMKEVCLL